MKKNLIIAFAIASLSVLSFIAGQHYGKDKVINSKELGSDEGFSINELEKYHLFFLKDRDGSISIEGLDPGKLQRIEHNYFVSGVQRLAFDINGNNFNPILFNRNESGDRISFFSAVQQRTVRTINKCVCIFSFETGSTAHLECDGSKLVLIREGNTEPIFTTTLNHIVYLNTDKQNIVIGVAQQEEFDKGNKYPCKCPSL